RWCEQLDLDSAHSLLELAEGKFDGIARPNFIGARIEHFGDMKRDHRAARINRQTAKAALEVPCSIYTTKTILSFWHGVSLYDWLGRVHFANITK
ncbi:MAG: hypothetical protein WBP92_08495, partial [Candidatus Acidiferrales bacterium]